MKGFSSRLGETKLSNANVMEGRPHDTVLLPGTDGNAYAVGQARIVKELHDHSAFLQSTLETLLHLPGVPDEKEVRGGRKWDKSFDCAELLDVGFELIGRTKFGRIELARHATVEDRS